MILVLTCCALLSVSLDETGIDRSADLSRAAAHPQAPIRKLKADENDIFNGAFQNHTTTKSSLTMISAETEHQPGAQEVRNERALSVYNRVQHKLTGKPRFQSSYQCLLTSTLGRDFNPEVALSVEVQVDRLIEQATSFENLCQCFSGWCAFW